MTAQEKLYTVEEFLALLPDFRLPLAELFGPLEQPTQEQSQE